MGELLSFKKLDYSTEAEFITERVFRSAFLPLKVLVGLVFVVAIIFYFLGFGSLKAFFHSSIGVYVQIAFWGTVLWAALRLKYGLRCPGCGHSFFRFAKRLQVKPVSCPHCRVIFLKKTHPMEEEYNYSREFDLLKIELERRAELAIVYLVVGIILFLYILMPLLSGLVGGLLTIFVILPVGLVFVVLYFIKQLELKCPSCDEYIKWTELRPTEVSKLCPYCNVKLVE